MADGSYLSHTSARLAHLENVVLLAREIDNAAFDECYVGYGDEVVHNFENEHLGNGQ